MNETQTPSQRLLALRQASGHSQSWCAEHIAHVSDRSWRYWEAGDKHGRTPARVPEDVLEAMHVLADAVQGALRRIEQQRQSR